MARLFLAFVVVCCEPLYLHNFDNIILFVVMFKLKKKSKEIKCAKEKYKIFWNI
jgi:hypothetical protein